MARVIFKDDPRLPAAQCVSAGHWNPSPAHVVRRRGTKEKMRPEIDAADRLEAWAYALIEQLRAVGVNLPPPEQIEFHALRQAKPEALMYSARFIASLTLQGRTLN